MNYLELQQRITAMVNLMSYPALTVQIFCRRKTGFRNLKPGPILAVGIFMWMFVSFWPSAPNLPLFGRGGEEEVFQEPPLVPLGWDADQPSDWLRMTPDQQRAWIEKHRITDPVLLKQQQEERLKEVVKREKAAEARAASAATWRRIRTNLAYWPMMAFIWAFVGWGLIQRRQRWHDLLRGVPWHSYSRGVSYLTPIFKDIMREPNTLRFMDPLLCSIIAFVVLQFSRPLGWWLIFASFCFYMVEQYVYEKQLDHAIDQHDNMVDAAASQMLMKHFKPGAVASALPSMEETGGVLTTGSASPELAAQVAKRREERRARLKEKAMLGGEETTDQTVGLAVDHEAYQELSQDAIQARRGINSKGPSGDLIRPEEDDRL